MAQNFTKLLKKSLTGETKVNFIYINNIEVEQYWNQNHMFILNTSLQNTKPIVNRIEEMGLLLAENDDYIVLREMPDENFLRYLEKLSFSLPKIVTTSADEVELNITESILNNNKYIDKIRAVAKESCFILPFGVSKLEEHLSHLTKIPLAVPEAAIFEKVNHKIYSRQLNEKLNIRQINGAICNSISEIYNNYDKLKYLLEKGRKLVLKESLGVSGKGLYLIDSDKKFHQFMKLLQRKKNEDNDSVAFVIEEWIDKAFDLNYQFIISKTGKIIFNYVKEAITKNGVHMGHLIPPRINGDMLDQIIDYSYKIGKELSREGYYGVVGIDAIVDTNNCLYPNLEINARLNMSTYQSIIQEKFISNKYSLSKYYTVKLYNRLDFKSLIKLIEPYNFDLSKDKGLIITNFSTVNANYKPHQLFIGRLYGTLIANTLEELRFMDEQIEKRLSNVKEVSLI
ncbi:ATP-grasp domain-containing protein [Parageobacillus thermoglucosidasius]|uniref:ATP-grasp domain-containing protein n=1 Tax=Parageobacillus thermoglucosidasius TaxID=1426 RepID=A0AB38R1S3_PARTM|nr:ATP-grasp domain-containing protein [Parageobacillus thermoglucosidasius]UOE77549.1 ATP-grasp domain-containing protein [Parageobacillus thermoglucosidasius]